MPKRPGIPTAPSTTSSGSGGGSGGSSSSSSSNGSSSSSSSGSSSSGSGGGGGYGSDSWYRKQQSKAAKKYMDQAATLEKQAVALRLALRKTLRQGIDVKLDNILRSQKQQDALLLEGYRSRVGDLKGSAEDNERSAADQSFAALTNAGRERAGAVTEAMSHGAGETDLLQAQQMALRSWDANQSEVRRAYHDTLRSVNSGLGDLNADTATGRANIALQANADREQLWTNYYNQRSEIWTNLGNVYGTQADAYSMANEAKGSKKAKRGQKDSSADSGRAFRRAARELGRSWENPGVPRAIREWEGAADIPAQGAGAPIEASLTTIPQRNKPEGASLRTWSV